MLKNYDYLAAQDLTNAMQLDPSKNFFYYYLRHLQYVYSGNLEKSLEDIKQSVKLAPDRYITTVI